jgi:predicted  nucleic acid-binding Zn-ribbon protein
MEEYICDVCGTAFSETDSVCPVCGCAKTAASHAAGETVEESGYVKGGRFSKSNVRKRTRSTAVSNTAPLVTDIPEVDDEDDEEEIIYASDANETVLGSSEEVLDAGFVIDEDSPEGIFDYDDGMDAGDEE